jgi:hypothetical protein
LQGSRFRLTPPTSARIAASIEAVLASEVPNLHAARVRSIPDFLLINRRDFLKESMASSAAFHLYGLTGLSPIRIAETAGAPGIIVLVIAYSKDFSVDLESYKVAVAEI